MKRAFTIGKLLGVKISMHWTFLLLILFVAFSAWSNGGGAQAVGWNIAYVLTIFFCVVLHELGHIQMGRRFGVNTKTITLLPIGGMANMESIPKKPKEELLVAIAGPLVNVGIAILLYPFIGDLSSYLQTQQETQNAAWNISAGNFVVNLFLVNVALVVFNLIPAFPMDGGRMLRAVLAMRMSRLKATQLASRTGQIMAVLFFFLGLLYNPILALVGIFVFFGARGENNMVQQDELLSGFRVKDVMSEDFEAVESTDSIDKAKDKFIATCDDVLLVMENGAPKGIVRRNEVITTIKERGEDIMISEITQSDYDALQSSDPLVNIVGKIRENGQSTFPVTENGHIAGIISLDHLQRFLSIRSELSY